MTNSPPNAMAAALYDSAPAGASDRGVTRLYAPGAKPGDLPRLTHVKDSAGNWRTAEELAAERQAAEAAQAAQRQAGLEASLRQSMQVFGSAVPTIGGEGGVTPAPPRGADAAPAARDITKELDDLFRHFGV